MTKSTKNSGKPAGKRPPPPGHLEQPESALWRKIVEEHLFDDAASQSILAAALEGHQRMRRCREKIDEDGELVHDRFNQAKPHPLLAAERDARAAFLSGMRILALDVGEVSP
jgi:hypothetical protein